MIAKLSRSCFAVRGNYYFGESIMKLRREKEMQLAQKIKKNLDASYVSVTDSTLGASSCGQMYKILVESPMFEGKSKVQQHQLVSEALKDQISTIHGFNLKTRVPKKAGQEKEGVKEGAKEEEPEKTEK